MQCNNVIERALQFRLQLRRFRDLENPNKVIVGVVVVVVVALGKVSFYVSSWDCFQKILTRRSPTSFPGFSTNGPYGVSRIWRLQVNDLGEGQISARFVSTEHNLVSGKCGHETVCTWRSLSSPLHSLRRDTKKRTLRMRLYGIIIRATRNNKMETYSDFCNRNSVRLIMTPPTTPIFD